MQGPRVTFHDGYWYCYANSTAMLLSSIGERVDPHLIEALTGVGLGAFLSRTGTVAGGLPFFSGLAGKPDQGITQALTVLGFGFEERASEESDAPPFQALAESLRTSPALLGPLDMRFLSYNPARPKGPGVDHYILADRVEAGRFVVYDPAGYAAGRLSEGDLAQAWRAAAIGYRRGSYRWWTRPRRLDRPSDDLIRARTIEYLKSRYAEADAAAVTLDCLTDGMAIRHLADLMRGDELTAAQSGHLLHFALPLGSKRALDYAAFFRPAAKELSALKDRQAGLFGASLSDLAEGNLPAAADGLATLADLEDAIRVEIERRA